MKARIAALLLLPTLLALGAAAAPVLVTPGSLAGYSYSPPASATGAGGSGSGPGETLRTCVVQPSYNDRSIVMSTRQWFGYTKPITVYYRMIGGGAGATYGPGGAFPQFQSGGGSSAILKNGSVVSIGPGMSAGGYAGTVVSGVFTVTNADVIRFVVGGGGGGGAVAGNYTGTGPNGFDYYGWSGGGGAGWFGGGAGSFTYYGDSSPPVPGGPVATGGGSSGGTGGGSGGAMFGGTNGAHPYNGGGGTAAAGASKQFAVYSGFGTYTQQVGGGGALGRSGTSAGTSVSCDPTVWGVPLVAPQTSDFVLHTWAGRAGFSYNMPASPPYVGEFCSAGGGFGQIVIQYQAPACDLIPDRDSP